MKRARGPRGSTCRGAGAARTYFEAGPGLPGSRAWNIRVAVRPLSGRRRCPWGPRSGLPERRSPALCWSRVPGPRPSTSGRFDRPELGIRALGRGGGWGRSEVFRGGARPSSPGRWPEPLGRFRGGVRPPGGHHVWCPPCMGASGPPGRIPGRGPRARWASLLTERGGCAGPLGRIPRRGPRPPNRSAEPPGSTPGSGSVGLYNAGGDRPERKTRSSNRL